ncbi:MAG: SpoIIE family protein phosphatase [Gemmataceae bacterium]
MVRRCEVAKDNLKIGRDETSDISLEAMAVSRHHAEISSKEGKFYLRDKGSINGTSVNGKKISEFVEIKEGDEIRVGPYQIRLVLRELVEDSVQVVRATIDVEPSNPSLFIQNASNKLKVLLEIANDLGKTLDTDHLLDILLNHLMKLFPQADRSMVLLCEEERLVIRSQRSRLPQDIHEVPYSRTIVNRAMTDGVGLLSEDVPSDRNLVLSATMVSLNLRSFLCVPLLGWERKPLGVIQLDCIRPDKKFNREDLELLTAVSIQASVVLQNAAYHQNRLREERLRQEIMLARDIQQQFLPSDFDIIGPGAEIFARCSPAREVSGDLFDIFRLKDGRIAFFIGDVSGKGMPAALFMIAVRSLARLIAPTASNPSEFLQKLNDALANDNPTHLFVTMIYGIYDGQDGHIDLANGGHPPPLLRATDGEVKQLVWKSGLLLGSSPIPLRAENYRLELQKGETLILYTDGFIEATPDEKVEFGVERLKSAFGGIRANLPLEQCAMEVSAMIRKFVGRNELQDDQTLLMLRRK